MEQMQQLNLPPASLSLRQGDKGHTEVYDVLRSKWVVMTPEEYVRQSFVHYMVGSLGFSPHRMAVEVGIHLNSTLRRVDVLVYDDFSRPLVIVEFKAPNIKITQRTFDQIVRYNMVIRAPYLIVSNGLRHYCCKVDMTTGGYEYLSRLPLYGEIKGGQ